MAIVCLKIWQPGSLRVWIVFFESSSSSVSLSLSLSFSLSFFLSVFLSCF